MGLTVLVSSLASVKLTRGKTSALRRMICLCVLLNQLVLIHSITRMRSPRVFQLDVNELQFSSYSTSPQPFVSLHILDTNCTRSEFDETLSSLLRNSSIVLAKEIIIPPSKLDWTTSVSDPTIPLKSSTSDSPTYQIYVKPGVTVSMDWLNGMVREFFAFPDSLIIPWTSNFYSGAMLNPNTGQLFTVSNDEVPVIPGVSIVGVPTPMGSSVVELIAQNRVVELSLLAWFCFDGIRATHFTHTQVVSLPDWRSLESETLDERITCMGEPKMNISKFHEKFSEFNFDDLPIFHIKLESNCLTVREDTILMEQCDDQDKGQQFKKVGTSSYMAQERCLDGGQGKKLIVYYCMRGNRNQMFQFKRERLMWGSLCVNKNLDMKLCDNSAKFHLINITHRTLP